ncbi:MAG: HIT domain-containing protein [Cytophagales bacterium]|nr:HIT domain-containing protein [Cytophagales bacterium]
MASIFTRIINREIPAHIVAEDDRFIAFLDVMPLVEGHTLVSPKQEVITFLILIHTTLADMIVFAKRVAIAIKKTILV